MKLRGRNAKRIPEKKRKRMEKTLKRMEKVRKVVDKRILQNIKDKLEWAREEKQKALQAIENFKKSIQINTRELLKLEGIILCLTQILEESHKGKK